MRVEQLLATRPIIEPGIGEVAAIDSVYDAYGRMNLAVSTYIRGLDPDEQASCLMVLNPLDKVEEPHQKIIMPIKDLTEEYYSVSQAMFESCLLTPGNMPTLLTMIHKLADPKLAHELYARLSVRPRWRDGYVDWLSQDYEGIRSMDSYAGERGYWDSDLWLAHKRAAEVAGPYNPKRGLGRLALHKMHTAVMNPLAPIFRHQQPVDVQCAIAALK